LSRVICAIKLSVSNRLLLCRVRRKRSGERFFPVFWKPKDDKVNLQTDTDDGSNHYAVL